MKRSNICAARAAAGVLLLGLSACGGGGGGGGGGDSLNVSFPQNPLQLSKYQWDLPASVPVTATVTGSTSASTLYVYIADQGNTFSTGQIPISQTGPDSYQATLSLPASATVGQHNGNLQLRICADAACNSVLNSSTLPYQVAVQPNPTVQAVPTPATITGQAVSTGSASTGYVDALGLRLPVFSFQGTPVYPIYVKASDPSGHLGLPYNMYSINNSFIAGPFNQAQFQLAFEGDDILAPGTYSGELTLTFCHDEQCTQVFNGSSTVPYTLTYAAAGSISPAAAAGATDWQGVDGGPNHNASVPMTVTPGTLAPRWLIQVSSAANSGSGGPVDTHLLTGAGKIFVLNGSIDAINEADGSRAWNGSTYPVAPMASAGGTLYLENDGLYALVESDGHQLFFNQAAAGVSAYAGPVAAGNTVLQDTSTDLVAYDGQSGASRGAPACLQAIEQGNAGLSSLAALDAQLNAYIPSGNGLVIANFGANQGCSQIAGANASGGEPMLDAAQSQVVVNLGSSLVDFNTASGTVNWTTAIAPPQSLYTGDNAVANGVVYAVAENPFAYPELQAYSEATGKLLWRWTMPEPFSESIFATGMVVTSNIAFVQGYAHVYAVDLGTHQAVWSLDAAGNVAVSANGILYVNSTNVFPATTDAFHPRVVAVPLH